MKYVLSLEQFASIESWMEAFLKLAVRTPGANYSDLVTDVYRKRMRAMFLLTGAKPPLADKEAEEEFRLAVAELIKNAQATSRAAPPKAIKLPAEDDFSDIA